PVLFAGSPAAAVARWIAQYGLGWILTPDNVTEIADQIISYATASDENARMQRHCFEVYQKHFSKRHILDVFDQELRALLTSEPWREAGPSETSIVSHYGKF